MLNQISYKPDGFGHLEDHPGNRYFLSFLGREILAQVAAEVREKKCVVHVVMLVEWTPETRAEVTKDFEGFKSVMSAVGVNSLIASNTSEDRKRWTKFIAMFGFPEPVEILLSELEI